MLALLIQGLVLCFEVITGSEFESANLKYGNFKITATLVLQKEDGSRYLFTQATDYVVYTNAKIIPNFVVLP